MILAAYPAECLLIHSKIRSNMLQWHPHQKIRMIFQEENIFLFGGMLSKHARSEFRSVERIFSLLSADDLELWKVDV